MKIPAPEVTELTHPYWDALGHGKLLFQRCECGHAFLPARHECPSCLSDVLAWEQASGRGKLVSWVVYQIAYNDAFKHRLPYNVAVVELEEGPRLITNMVDAHEALACDAPVQLVVQTVDGVALARFALA
ncbi:MAG: OB-fold domain-containing protein [Burkholderiaceae bacterium]|nr:OB-fold domain-containing protein [Burkholderiaceae bacterium]